MAVGQHYELTILTNDGGDTSLMVNRLVYEQIDAEQLSTPAEDLVSAWQQDIQTQWLDRMPVTRVLRGYTVRCIEDPFQHLNVSGVDLAGTRVGNMMPPQVSAILSWRTLALGRRFRGRTYFPGLSVSDGDATGRLSSAAQTAFINLATDMILISGTSPVTATWSLVVHSVAQGAFTPVTDVVVPIAPGVQRKRRLGVGA